MRSKKNREVNIFSASVVDLFASGLGVFLIVSIIALANQKKDDKKSDSSSERTTQLVQEVTNLKSKLEAMEEQNLQLKVMKIQKSHKSSGKIEAITQEMKGNTSKKELLIKLKKVLEEVEKLEIVNSIKKRENKELKQKIVELENKKESSKFDSKVGSIIKLENVHFYPGTDNPIEPYASRELEELASYLTKKRDVRIEVSGHIFRPKEEILSGVPETQDNVRVSHQRARRVCRMLESLGVNIRRMSCKGYGSTRYTHLTNDMFSKEAQLNRRVEIQILSN